MRQHKIKAVFVDGDIRYRRTYRTDYQVAARVENVATGKVYYSFSKSEATLRRRMDGIMRDYRFVVEIANVEAA